LPFDTVLVPDECYNANGKQSYLRAKLHILDISPYDDTLLLDADMAWLWPNGRTPSQLIKTLEKLQYTVQNAGPVVVGKKSRDEMLWADPKEILNTWEIKAKKLYRIFTECLWIKNSPENHELMAMARQIFDDPKVKHAEFAGGVPDELALCIAMGIIGIKPHKDDFYPVYWKAEQRRRSVPLNSMIDVDFYALSIGGKSVSRPVHEMYDNLVAGAFQKMGVKNPYAYRAKSKILHNRKLM
jgi:hypothetical protein